MLLLRLSGLFLLRFAERNLSGLLFQEPPRSTRRVQSGPSPLVYYPGKNLFPQAQRIGLSGMADPALHRGVDVVPR